MAEPSGLPSIRDSQIELALEAYTWICQHERQSQSMRRRNHLLRILDAVQWARAAYDVITGLMVAHRVGCTPEQAEGWWRRLSDLVGGELVEAADQHDALRRLDGT